MDSLTAEAMNTGLRVGVLCICECERTVNSHWVPRMQLLLPHVMIQNLPQVHSAAQQAIVMKKWKLEESECPPTGE